MKAGTDKTADMEARASSYAEQKKRALLYRESLGGGTTAVGVNKTTTPKKSTKAKVRSTPEIIDNEEEEMNEDPITKALMQAREREKERRAKIVEKLRGSNVNSGGGGGGGVKRRRK